MSFPIYGDEDLSSYCWMDLAHLPSSEHPWFDEFCDRVQQNVQDPHSNQLVVYPDCLEFPENYTDFDREYIRAECSRIYGELRISKHFRSLYDVHAGMLVSLYLS